MPRRQARVLLGAVTTLTPDLVTGVWAVATPAVSVGSITVAPDLVSATWSVATPGVSTGSVTVAPDAVSATWSAATPSVSVGSVTVTPDLVSAAWDAPTPTVSGSVTVAPDLVTGAWAAFAPTVTVGSSPHPIRRVRISTPPRRRHRVQVDSEILVVSDVRPRVVQRRVAVPAAVSSEFALAVTGVAAPHVLRAGTVSSDMSLDVGGMIRASIDNEAEIIGLALGVSAEIAQELV